MFDAILDSVKGEVTEGLMGKLGLSNTDVDKTLSSTKEAFDKTIADETQSNGVENLLNLFSKDSNSGAADGILGSLGSNLLSSLTSNGFDSDKASSIKAMILPIVMKFAADKIGGDSNLLSGLLGGAVSDGIAGKAKDVLKGLF